MLNPQTTTRWEIAALIIVILLGVVLRLAVPSHMSVEHFDEGVYASSIWFGEDEFFQYPNRHYFAPPLLPGLIEVSMVLFGERAGAMIPSLVAGCISLVLVWWLARKWFGPEAGLATATLASFSDFHQLYTRTALTEALLIVWLLVAVYFLAEGLRSLKGVSIVAAGIATALAWWTKYNGWLPLAIGLAAVGCWTAVHPRRWRQAIPALFIVSSVALIAFVLWSPVPLDLHQHWGGYQVIASNHRRYVVGLPGWVDSFLYQVANHRYFEGWLSCLSVGVAFLLGSLVCSSGSACGESHRLAPRVLLIQLAIAVALVAAAAWIGSSVLLGAIAAGGILARLCARNHETLKEDETLHTYLLGAWFFGLLIATPCYRPYPRLTLPWLVSAWLGSGAAMGQITAHLARLQKALGGRMQGRLVLLPVAGLLLSGALLLVSAPRLTRQAFPALASRNGFEPIARSIYRDAQRIAANDPSGRRGEAEIYIYGEPGLFFHLRLQGAKLMAIEQLDFQRQSPVPTFLVTGPHAQRSPEFDREWKEVSDWFEHVETYTYRPSRLVLVNHFRPQELRQMDKTPTLDVRLYRLK